MDRLELYLPLLQLPEVYLSAGGLLVLLVGLRRIAKWLATAGWMGLYAIYRLGRIPVVGLLNRSPKPKVEEPTAGVVEIEAAMSKEVLNKIDEMLVERLRSWLNWLADERIAPLRSLIKERTDWLASKTNKTNDRIANLEMCNSNGKIKAMVKEGIAEYRKENPKTPIEPDTHWVHTIEHELARLRREWEAERDRFVRESQAINPIDINLHCTDGSVT